MEFSRIPHEHAFSLKPDVWISLVRLSFGCNKENASKIVWHSQADKPNTLPILFAKTFDERRRREVVEDQRMCLVGTAYIVGGTRVY